MREEARFIARHYIKDVEGLVMAEVWFGLKLTEAKSREIGSWFSTQHPSISS